MASAAAEEMDLELRLPIPAEILQIPVYYVHVDRFEQES